MADMLSSLSCCGMPARTYGAWGVSLSMRHMAQDKQAQLGQHRCPILVARQNQGAGGMVVKRKVAETVDKVADTLLGFTNAKSELWLARRNSFTKIRLSSRNDSCVPRLIGLDCSKIVCLAIKPSPPVVAFLGRHICSLATNARLRNPFPKPGFLCLKQKKRARSLGRALFCQFGRAF
ncbi:hypothetical protein ACFQ14_02980 [Pseudahrensia aquimaris]|uniref:Uncharacterized protein n=1 Tax=Pseudahrensia aquimaris TaxID=744461 RepID=A0ABW3FBV3_9HYPH